MVAAAESESTLSGDPLSFETGHILAGSIGVGEVSHFRSRSFKFKIDIVVRRSLFTCRRARISLLSIDMEIEQLAESLVNFDVFSIKVLLQIRVPLKRNRSVQFILRILSLVLSQTQNGIVFKFRRFNSYSNCEH